MTLFCGCHAHISTEWNESVKVAGEGPYHRVTELGEVKIRNGNIIDKFQQLVNPQRFISREIEALTGISNEMVRVAPKLPRFK